jgi:peptidoglycan hydrolase-like protein with peptidoglycan-binding domain
MKRIAMIAFAVALGLAWTGAAIPADVKEETQDTKDTLKDKAETAKDKLKSAGETTKDKLKSGGEKVKDKTVELKDKAKAKLSGKDKADSSTMDRSARVRMAQQALQEKGYNPGPIDGVMGAKTRAALKEFQRKEGLEANGRLDMTTMSRLGMETRTSETPSTEPSASPGTSR